MKPEKEPPTLLYTKIEVTYQDNIKEEFSVTPNNILDSNAPMIPLKTIERKKLMQLMHDAVLWLRENGGVKFEAEEVYE